jgi:hypothetical protein
MAGRRIDDHGSWMGGKGKDTVFPGGPYKTKDESSAMGAGSLAKYEDTTETIKAQQEASVSKTKSHAHKPGTRY